MNKQISHCEDKLAFETDSWELKVAMESGENVMVVDAPSPEAYRKERIPGSVDISHRKMHAETTASLDRSALIVTYCDGFGYNASTKGTPNMTKLAFRAKELTDGLDWWKSDGHGMEASGPTSEAVGCG